MFAAGLRPYFDKGNWVKGLSLMTQLQKAEQRRSNQLSVLTLFTNEGNPLDLCPDLSVTEEERHWLQNVHGDCFKNRSVRDINVHQNILYCSIR
jgi:hypothetical protein